MTYVEYNKIQYILCDAYINYALINNSLINNSLINAVAKILRHYR